jgi:hypothetical protein
MGRESGEPLDLPLVISAFDHDVAALDVSEVTQSVEEGISLGVRGRVASQGAYSSDLGRGLRLSGARHREQAEGAEEDASVHYSITWSARRSSDGGIVRPSAFAVLRLITSSNLVGCCTGR